jgi:hypothetical protein
MEITIYAAATAATAADAAAAAAAAAAVTWLFNILLATLLFVG